MRRKKGFEYGEGKYYLTIKSSPNNITLYRESKGSAVQAYYRYKGVGKDVEWQGQWNGKEFVDSQEPREVPEMA
jgi:hypothetical protein